MGLLGTLVYAGLTISSVVSPFLLTRVETPWPVLSWALVLSAGTSMLLHINLSWRVMFLALGAGTFATTLALSAIPRNVWTVSARSDRVVRGMWSF